ncbi:MAG: cysteine hydrolase family protein, partial [Candidatus Saccharimonadales bacterium]
MPSKQKYDTLLIIIDLQKGWIHKTATEATMLRAAALAEKFDGDVIHCRFWNNPDSLFHKQLQWKRFTENYDTEEIPEIAKLKLPTYWRDTYSVINDETLPIIKKYKHVYLAGVYTDISIASTAMGIFDLNIPVSVVKDCVATLHGPTVHEAAIKSLGFAIGRD